MAILITTQPSANEVKTLTSAIQIVAASTDAAIVNIIADIFINGSYYTTQTIAADASNAARFVLNGIAENSLRSQRNASDFAFALSSPSFLEECHSAVTVQVKFYEETEGTDGLLTTTWVEDGAGTPAATSNSFYILSFIDEQHLPHPIANYTATSNRKFFTVRPRIYTMRGDETPMLSIYNNGSIADIQITTYNSSGAVIATADTSNTLSSELVITLCCGVSQINTAFGTTIIDSNVASFDIKCLDWGSLPLSETFTFQIDRHCTDSYTQFFFVNSLGGHDSAFFPNYTEHTNSAKRSTYAKYDADNIYSPKRVVLNVHAENEHTVESDDLGIEGKIWMADLIQARQAFAWYKPYSTATIQKGAILFKDSDITFTFEQESRLQATYSFVHTKYMPV